MTEHETGSSRGSLGSLSVPEMAALWGILTIGLLLRVVGLGWGLPPAIPEVAASGIRSSYAIDEDKSLRALATTNPASFDFDPELYDWGTLHLELVLLALEGAQAAGVFETPWREAFLDLVPGDFEKVYTVGRAVSVASDLATVFLAFLLASKVAGRRAGLWAAALVSFAPGHVLQASQIRVDVTATTLVTLAALLSTRTRSNQRAPSFLFGLVAGLAVATKYSTCLIVAALAGMILWDHPRRGAAARWIGLGAVAGFLAGEPFVITNGAEVVRQVGEVIVATHQAPLDLVIPKPLLLGQHFANLTRFSIGVPAVILAGYGLWSLRRRRAPGFLTLVVPLAVGFIALAPQTWPMMRYHLPLVPFCAIAAGAGIVQLRGWKGYLGGALALVMALCASLAQVRFMLYPHPVNLALAVIHKAVPAGEPVARIMPELPPLDSHVHPMGPNPLIDDLSRDPPRWVVTTNFPLIDYPEGNKRLLESRYRPVAVFRSRRIFAWATLGEWGAPHDWKYTHPSMTVYRLR